MSGRRVGWLGVAILFGGVVASAPSSVRAGDRLWIVADLDSPVVTVKGIVPGTRLVTTLLARDGTVLQQEVHRPNQTQRAVMVGTLEPGMELVARNAGRVARAPVLDILPRVDRVGDLMRGVAPPGSQVEIVAIHVPRGGEPDRTIRRVIDIDEDGRWRWDTSARLDLLGGDSTFVTVRTEDSTFTAGGAVPLMWATLGSSAVNACDLDHEGPARFTLLTSGHAVKATATWTTGPRCHPVTLRDDAWKARVVRAGDILRGDFAADARLLTEPLLIRPDASDDGATGRCPSAGWWSARRSDLLDARGATGDGRFVMPRGALGDLHPGEFVGLTCTAASGDSISGGGVTVP